ncbi:hemerythrin domain-containing protein [Nonomuraea polychroma]|uniref:hemerythrin domain-containing protein n=1 Tax=Nonomuraea polychroma TaxID=46176 RepID=UPI003D8CFAC7
MRINCLTMCQEFHHHHSREDGSVFPALGARHPDLGPALERLSAEHVAIDELLNQLKALLSREEPDRELLLSEVDRLIKELVAHLDYEEERIASLLNAGI